MKKWIIEFTPPDMITIEEEGNVIADVTDMKVARLMAAAPDLLEALKYSMDGCNCNGIEKCRYCMNAREVIKKAEAI